jgi:hypothetical protein
MVKLARGADTGAIQGRVGAKLTPNFGVEAEAAGGVDGRQGLYANAVRQP